jgi:hypothetical protein
VTTPPDPKPYTAAELRAPDAEITPAATIVEALSAEVAKLRAERDQLRDAMHVARKRIRVLRGTDVLTTASSRGVVIWLKAILDENQRGYATAVGRQLKALIETLEGADV